MYHDHLYVPQRKPSPAPVFDYKLDDFASVEVPACKFGVWRKFFKGLHVNVVGLHDRVHYGGDYGQVFFGFAGRGRREWLDEVDVRIWARCALVEPLEPKRHLKGVATRAFDMKEDLDDL